MDEENVAPFMGCGCFALVVLMFWAGLDRILALFAHTVPVLPLAIIATVVWLIVRNSENIVWKSVGSLLGPVALGLTLLTLLLMVLNGAGLAASDDTVASAEEFLIALRLAVTEAADVSLPAMIGTIGVLIALSAIVP